MALIGNIDIGMRVITGPLTKGFGVAKGAVKSFEHAIMSTQGLIAGFGVSLGAGAFVGYIRGAMDSILQTRRLAGQLGSSAQALVGLRYAAKLTGTDLETFDGGMIKLVANLGDATMKVGPVSEALDKLGLKGKTLAQMDPAEAFVLISQGLRKIPNPAVQASIAMDLFGRKGVLMLNTLRAGPEELKKLAAEAKDLGISFTDIDSAQVKQASHAMERLEAVLSAIGVQLAIQISPYLAASGDQFLAWAKTGFNASTSVSKSLGMVTASVGVVADLVQVLELAFLGLRAAVTMTIGYMVHQTALAAGAIADLIEKVTGKGSEEKFRNTWKTIDKTFTEESAKTAAQFVTELAKPPPSAGIANFLKGIEDGAKKAAGELANAAKADRSLGDALVDMTKKVDELNKSLKEQIETFGMNAHEASIFKLKMEGATEGQLVGARASAKLLSGMEAVKKIQEANQTPLQKFREEMAKLNQLRQDNLINPIDFKKESGRLHHELTETMKPQHAGALELGSAEARTAILNQMTGTGQGKAAEETAKNTSAMVKLLEKITQRRGQRHPRRPRGSGMETTRIPA